MFTGIIEAIGTIRALTPKGGDVRVLVDTGKLDLGDVKLGDSIAVNGVCLTAVDPDDGGFAADVMNQTLELTTLGELEPGAPVNLEPALRASDRLGGHLVAGHVDATAAVSSVREDGIARRLRITLPEELARYVAGQGSITLDGVSLTVAALDGAEAEVSLIPETLARTTLGAAEPGRCVNLEVDLMARYAERLLRSLQTSEGG